MGAVKSLDRTTYLGSHAAAAIAGVHPFKSPLQLYMDMKGLSEKQEAPWLEMGLRMQGVILQKFEDEHDDFRLEREQTLIHETHDFIGSTPDGISLNPQIVVEAKNIRFKDPEKWGDPGTDRVPQYVLMQAHHHMLVTGFPVCFIPVLFSGQVYEEFIVHRDIEMGQMILDMLVTFWTDCLKKDNPPELDGSDAARAFLRKKYPLHSAEVRRARPEEVLLLQDYALHKRAYAEAEGNLRLSQNRIIDAIGDMAGIEHDGIKVTYKQTKDSERTDWKMVSEDLSEHVSKGVIAGALARNTVIRPGSRRWYDNIKVKGKEE